MSEQPQQHHCLPATAGAYPTNMNRPKLPSQMSSQQFIQTFHAIYESTPSIPETAHPSITSSHDTPETLHSILSEVFNALPDAEKLSILNAHPRLAGPTATVASSSEQASRGLDRLSGDVQQRFDELNDRYQQRFGWPFIIPVKDYAATDILDIMQTRLARDSDDEFAEACRCVDRIAQLRLTAWFLEHHPGLCEGKHLFKRKI